MAPAPRLLLPYFSHPRVEITIVVDGAHRKIQPRHANEVLIVRDPSYPVVPRKAGQWLRSYQKPYFEQLYYLSATEELDRARREAGFNSHYVNQGCFIEPAVFAPTGAAKEFDAVYTARFARLPHLELWYRHLRRARYATSAASAVRELAQLRLPTARHREEKRHWLTERIPRLALVDPMNHRLDRAMKRHYESLPNCVLSNEKRLPPGEVARIVGRAHCGLILSDKEGICRASSEYLLCGVPVVSTPSTGGRDVWYDSYNSIIVEPDPDAVLEAVQKLQREPRDPIRIREGYLARARMFQARFARDVLQPILTRYGVELDPFELMRTHPYRWWRDRVKPT